jgi:hypothetical protein
VKQYRLIGNFVLWSLGEFAVMAAAAWIMKGLIAVAGSGEVGKGITAATVLLSVAVAIIVQLWVRLNDLSGLASLTPVERRRLWAQVRSRARALVSLTIFFTVFIFFVLATSAIATSQYSNIASLLIGPQDLLIGVSAGFGACVVLVAGVLVDLNEVANFRWTVETSDQAARKAAQIKDELRVSEAGFESDENIQGYKRVSGT